MILSVSRRTDIPCCYPDWFYNRLRAGFAYVRNPMNFHQVSRIPLTPELVDCIVFWTKNPTPMLPRLRELEDYPFYFQFTLTPYGSELEPGLPSKSEIVLPAFQALSRQIGAERVIWRYDPILLNTRYTVKYHIKAFEQLAEKLEGFTRRCIISFIDLYRNTAHNAESLQLLPFTAEEQLNLAGTLAKIAKRYGVEMSSCSEALELKELGISHASCIDAGLIEQIARCRLEIKKDKNQRPECRCAESIDLGAYNSCTNGCKYCYANYNEALIGQNCRMHDPCSPLLFGDLSDVDIVRERAVKSSRISQQSLFDPASKMW